MTRRAEKISTELERPQEHALGPSLSPRLPDVVRVAHFVPVTDYLLDLWAEVHLH